MTEKWITTDEAAELTGYDVEYVRRLLRKGKVQSKKFGAVWQVDRDSLLSYLRDSQNSDDKRRGPKP
jgi:excisionase family DNA binding protein